VTYNFEYDVGGLVTGQACCRNPAARATPADVLR